MKLNLLFSFFKKNKSGLNSEDKPQSSSAGRSSSAWSWSYDLNITERCEAAMKLATKSEHSETDFEDKNSSGLSLDEVDDEFIFQRNPQIEELTMIERFISRASENFGMIKQKNEEGHLQISARNLMSGTKISVDDLNDVKRLRLSDMQEQRSWLDRITRPFSGYNNDEMKLKNQEQRNKSQIYVILNEYLLQFIHKTALPAIQKYQQLQKRYCNQMKEWKKKADILERQNAWLKSELQNVDKSYRDTEEELSNLKKFYNHNKLRTGVNWKSASVLNESKKSLDLDLEVEGMPDVKPHVSLEPECAGETEESIKIGCCGHINPPQLDRVVTVNESQSYHGEKFDQADKLKMQRKLYQERVQRRNVSRQSKNSIVPEDAEALKVDKAPLESNSVNSQQEPYNAQSSNREYYSFMKRDQLNRIKELFGVEASRNHGGCGRRTVKEEALAHAPYVMKESVGTNFSFKTSDLLGLTEKTLPKSLFIDPYVLDVSDSWYLQNKDQAAGTLNDRVLKVENERRLVNSPIICPANAIKSSDCRDQCSLGNIISNKSISRNAIKSIWL